jgi:hypothetical protein
VIKSPGIEDVVPTGGHKIIWLGRLLKNQKYKGG